jgi:tRNA 2-thiouridine synthesizing protein A
VSKVTRLDCRGELCPLPVIALAREIQDLAVGDELELLADDPAAAVDVPAWCRMRGQLLVQAGEGVFRVRRAR